MATPGQASDKTRAPELVTPLGLTGDVVGERGFFAWAAITAIEATGATAHIPSQRNVRAVRSVDRTLYRERNRIERFFNRLKHFRGIATRYFKTANNFLAALHLASAQSGQGSMSPLRSTTLFFALSVFSLLGRRYHRSMARIFISYSKKHAAVTERIASHLEEAGHDVWWDVNLLAGHAFRDAIKEQLVASDLVVVIWTQASIRSQWVIAEAQHGFERGVLLPLLHSDANAADIPMPFGNLHTVSTADLDGLLKQIEARNGSVVPSKAAKATSVMGAFFNPSERPLPSEPQTWDLSALYNDPSEIEADLLRLEDSCAAFSSAYRGRLADLSGQDMLACLTDYGEIDETAGRIMSYLGLRRYSDTHDNEAFQLMSETQARVSAITESLVFFSLEVTKLTDSQIAAMMREVPKLGKYRAVLAHMRMMAPHQLSERDELALHRASEQIATLKQDFDNRMGTLQVNLRYPSYPDERLPLEAALNRFTDPETEVREAALEGLSEALAEQGDALLDINLRLIRDQARTADARGFTRPDASRLLAERVQPKWIDAIMSTLVASHSQTTHRYYALKAKWLGDTGLKYQDRNAPLPAITPTYTYREALEIVHETFDSVSPRLGQLLHEFFTSRWVDARPVESRAPGAFVHPTVPSAHPFVHTHFYGTSRDVITLGSMMGHGTVQALAQRNGPLLDQSPLSFSNAIASFFETLVTESLMLRAPDQARLVLTAGFLEDRLNTIERQAMFFRFEKKTHQLAVSNSDVNVKDVNALWIAEQKAFLGPDAVVPEAVGWTWAYIPHFVHSPFYTVTYAFGGLLSSVMYAAYLEEREGHSSRFIKRLLRAMDAGGTVDLAGKLEILEIDPEDRATWRTGVEVTSAIIDTLVNVDFAKMR